MIKTGYTLEDIGRSLSWGALGSFLHHIDLDTETARELSPEYAGWSTSMKTNAILADIYDVLAMINANLCAMGTGKRATKPKAYPRPGDKDKKQIGKNALPPDELKEWFAKKRKEHKKDR